MVGYTFETINKKTGEKYIGKRYSVVFDKNYFGEEKNEAIAKDIEKYGRPSFESHMIMPYEDIAALDAVFETIEKPKIEPVEEKRPTKRSRKKIS